MEDSSPQRPGGSSSGGEAGPGRQKNKVEGGGGFLGKVAQAEADLVSLGVAVEKYGGGGLVLF